MVGRQCHGRPIVLTVKLSVQKFAPRSLTRIGTSSPVRSRSTRFAGRGAGPKTLGLAAPEATPPLSPQRALYRTPGRVLPATLFSSAGLLTQQAENESEILHNRFTEAVFIARFARGFGTARASKGKPSGPREIRASFGKSEGPR